MAIGFRSGLGRVVLAGLVGMALPVAGWTQSAPVAPAATNQAGAAATPAAAPDWMKVAGGKMAFDVASVRLSKPDAQSNASFPIGPGDMYGQTGGAFSGTGLPLAAYINFAYKINSNQIQQVMDSLPEWTKNEHYDIQAKSENHDPTKDQMRLMMQALLADRFKVKVHYESRQLSVYVLTVAKPGKLGPQLKLHPADVPCSVAPPPPPDPTDAAAKPTAKPAGTSLVALVGVWPEQCGGLGGVMSPSTPGRLRLGGRNVAMKLIATSLTSPIAGIDKPVLDQTGLQGNYDFLMEFSPQIPAGANAPQGFTPDASGPEFMEALRDQLGLKLESQKGAVDAIVVDHVEKPTEN